MGVRVRLFRPEPVMVRLAAKVWPLKLALMTALVSEFTPVVVTVNETVV